MPLQLVPVSLLYSNGPIKSSRVFLTPFPYPSITPRILPFFLKDLSHETITHNETAKYISSVLRLSTSFFLRYLSLYLSFFAYFSSLSLSLLLFLHSLSLPVLHSLFLYLFFTLSLPILLSLLLPSPVLLLLLSSSLLFQSI